MGASGSGRTTLRKRSTRRRHRYAGRQILFPMSIPAARAVAWNHSTDGIVQLAMILRVAAFALAASSTFAQTFFPASALHNTSAIRYTQFLRALHEPSLFELASHDPNAQAYRLLWLRDTDRPASIRFVIKPSGTEWFYRHDGRYRINAADWLARERNVLVLEIAHGFFSEDGR